MNTILPLKTIIRRFSLSSTEPALGWPKPDYGPSRVHRSNYLNGIRVGASLSLGTQMSACTIMFKAGSRYEKDDEIGATHFIRAASAVNGLGYSGFIKSRYLQQHGGYITCNSDRQTISFTLRCPMPLFRDLKWYLLDAAVRCCYREIDLEDFVRPMVTADLDRIPLEQRVIDLVQKAFWAGPLNNSIFCQKERIGGISTDILNCFAGTFFKTSRCTFGSVGVPFEETLMLADNIDCGRTERPPDPFQFSSFPRAGYETYDLGPGSETYIAVAVLGCGTRDIPCLLKHAIVAEACGTGNVAVGQHAMDRIPHPPLGTLAGDDVFTQFRAFNISYEETGIFGILVKTRSETARQAAFAATQFLANVKDLSFSQIQVGKRRLQVAVALNDDDCVLSSEALALQVANFGWMDSARDTINMIDTISAADVSDTAMTLSDQCSKMAVAVVGDVGATPHDFELLRK